MRYLTAGMASFVLFAAGVPLLAPDLVRTNDDPHVFALTHLAALGWITTTIMGALFQLYPVALGGEVRAPRLAPLELPGLRNGRRRLRAQWHLFLALGLPRAGGGDWPCAGRLVRLLDRGQVAGLLAAHDGLDHEPDDAQRSALRLIQRLRQALPPSIQLRLRIPCPGEQRRIPLKMADEEPAQVRQDSLDRASLGAIERNPAGTPGEGGQPFYVKADLGVLDDEESRGVRHAQGSLEAGYSTSCSVWRRGIASLTRTSRTSWMVDASLGEEAPAAADAVRLRRCATGCRRPAHGSG
jgi:hypothetical protein